MELVKKSTKRHRKQRRKRFSASGDSSSCNVGPLGEGQHITSVYSKLMFQKIGKH